MSEREYQPPQIDNATPDDVLSKDQGADFTNILQRRQGNIIRGRSIAVFVDGACAYNGTYKARAGMGIFFGPGSDYNFSQRLWGGPQTNQRAEIRAAILALSKVRDLLDQGDLNTKTVVLASDSAYVCKAMTEWVFKWRSNGWTNARGWEVTNREDFEELDDLIDLLEQDYGVYVRLWQVGRAYNNDADKLAREAAY